jgi:hypothetical protein
MNRAAVGFCCTALTVSILSRPSACPSKQRAWNPPPIPSCLGLTCFPPLGSCAMCRPGCRQLAGFTGHRPQPVWWCVQAGRPHWCQRVPAFLLEQLVQAPNHVGSPRCVYSITSNGSSTAACNHHDQLVAGSKGWTSCLPIRRKILLCYVTSHCGVRSEAFHKLSWCIRRCCGSRAAAAAAFRWRANGSCATCCGATTPLDLHPELYA